MNKNVVEAVLATVLGAIILSLFSVIHAQGKALSVAQESQRTQAVAVLELKDTIKDMFSLMREQSKNTTDIESRLSKSETEITSLRRDVDRIEGKAL